MFIACWVFSGVEGSIYPLQSSPFRRVIISEVLLKRIPLQAKAKGD